MDYIVIELIPGSHEFENLYVINQDNLLELHNFIKESFDTYNIFYIFDKDANFIEIF